MFCAVRKQSSPAMRAQSAALAEVNRLIDAVAAWPPEQAQAVRERARAYARDKANDADVVGANLELFRSAQG